MTTKTGSYNERASVTVRSQYGMSTLANLNLYKNMMSGSELMDFWVRSGIHSEDWVKTNFSDRGYTNNTEWYRYFMNLVTPQYQNDVTIEGGGRNVAYMVSASQYHQEGSRTACARPTTSTTRAEPSRAASPPRRCRRTSASAGASCPGCLWAPMSGICPTLCLKGTATVLFHRTYS
ncbi:MAG TPA: hypothetical protein IAC35_06330 [Candidatus Cryptobacteroides merdipullorum]|uniref:Uncharacterized protein n=1 Tax=Candidatus Cryptobacteroides merdipullorum TaxID=2840771 RepID=A0A9D1KH69_9BACT|nr:hypothetical protein [Candidatus Cryptobacteroides merdipullorum]